MEENQKIRNIISDIVSDGEKEVSVKTSKKDLQNIEREKIEHEKIANVLKKIRSLMES